VVRGSRRGARQLAIVRYWDTAFQKKKTSDFTVGVKYGVGEGNRDWRSEPFDQRREKLESLLASAMPLIHLTLATRAPSVASDWFRRFEGAGL